MSGTSMLSDFDLEQFFGQLMPLTASVPSSQLLPNVRDARSAGSPPASQQSDENTPRWDSLPDDVLHRLLRPCWGVNAGAARRVCTNWRNGVENTYEVLRVRDWPPRASSLSKFRALTSLDLTSCYFDPRSLGQIDEVLLQLSRLPGLLQLHLSKESLVIKQSLRSRVGRTRLYYVMELPASIGNLTSLQCLSIVPCTHQQRSSNITSVVELPSELSRLGSLSSLKLCHSKQPLHWLAWPSLLSHLELYGAMTIQACTAQLVGLTQLKHLTLDFKNSVQVIWGAARANLLRSCAHVVKQLPHLTELRFVNVSEPGVMSLDVQVEVHMGGEPAGPLQLEPAAQQLREPVLQVIDFSRWSPSPLNIMDSVAMLLPSLTSVTMSYNGLSHIPSQISTLSKLTYLDIRGNQEFRGELPTELASLTVLEKLFAPHNGITAVGSLARLSRLRELDLSHNFVAGWGVDFLGLTSLTKLDLGCNYIQEVEPGVTVLRQLQHCDLHRNRLRTLPADFSALVRLTFLNLSYNHLVGVPDALSGLTQLHDLAIHNQEASNHGAGAAQGGLAYFEARDLHLVLYSQVITLPRWLATLPRLLRLWIDVDPHIYSEVLNVLRTRGVALNPQEPQSWKRGRIIYEDDFNF